MFDVIWAAAGGPLLAILLVGAVLFVFGARRITAMAHLVSRETVGKSAREDADPLANKSFDERVAARLKELEGGAKPIGTERDEPAPPARGFGRRRA